MKKTDLRDICIGLVLGTVICGCASTRWPDLNPWRVSPTPAPGGEDSAEVVVEPVVVTPADPEPVPAPVVEEDEDYTGIVVRSSHVAVDGAVHAAWLTGSIPVCRVDGKAIPVIHPKDGRREGNTNARWTTIWGPVGKGWKRIEWSRAGMVLYTWPLSEAVTEYPPENLLHDHETTGDEP